MNIIFGVIFVVIIGVAIFYFYNYEKANEEIYNLESKLDDANYEKKRLKVVAENAEKFAGNEIATEIYAQVFQEQNYDSVKNLENKIKTTLEKYQVI